MIRFWSLILYIFLGIQSRWWTHRHDPYLAFPWLDDAGAIGPDKACLALLAHDLLNPNHIVLGDALSDTHHQF